MPRNPTGAAAGVRMFTPADLPAFAAYEAAMHAISGREDNYHGPYGVDVPFPDDLEERTARRIAAAVGSAEWRRYWGAFVDGVLVGVGHVSGGGLASERHRCMLGMGVLPAHRRRGHARALLRAIVAWCRAEPSLAWIDLGVFADNPHAAVLYRSEGFVELGRTPDRFRVDGHRIDDVHMALAVADG